jgi:hypothetical protein
MVNNFTVCQNPYNDLSWWHKNIFTTIFLLLYFLLPLRMGPTCHRDTHQVFTYLILSLHPPAPSFPLTRHFFLRWKTAGNGWRRGHPSGGQVGPTGPTTRPVGHPPWPCINSQVLPSSLHTHQPRKPHLRAFAVLPQKKGSLGREWRRNPRVA